jgi:hypothetical protein
MQIVKTTRIVTSEMKIVKLSNHSLSALHIFINTQ